MISIEEVCEHYHNVKREFYLAVSNEDRRNLQNILTELKANFECLALVS